ncbi:unnamed protein product [Urochloa decumbens]|uniref:F-box associated beta-propeller type 3 domain-containing protein n=1 Tax=Urochloa decumbens TaxID=240449 RepID=A0ABC9BPI6_9POAL
MATPPPTDGEVDVDEGLSLPTDAFVERDVIDARTPRIPPPKVLAFFTSNKSASVYVVDDLERGRGRQVWRVSAKERRIRRVAAVGTCNGLLCLCDEDKPGGAIALLNPATGKTVRVPPLPVSYRGRYGYAEAYTFGFVPETGKYKLLHLPCRGNSTGGFSVLQAFTLGDAAWRDVAVVAPGDSCRLHAGVVNVGGAAYWVTKGMVDRVVSFDLRDERVAFDAALPVGAGGTEKTELWVLGDDGRQRWSKRYSVRVEGVGHRLAAPHFAHGGEYVLTVQSEGWEKRHLHSHRMRDAGRRLLSSEVRSVRIEEPGTAVASFKEPGCLRTFANVETTEPLSVYKV